MGFVPPGEKMQFLPHTLEFLKLFGFRFGLDLDEQVIIESPETVVVAEIVSELEKHNEAIKRDLTIRAKNARQQCVGGPFNGRRHCQYFGCPILFHIKRAKWAVYVVSRDGRAFFLGYETSKKKGRLMALRSEHQPKI